MLTYFFIIHKLDTNSKHFITIRINSPSPAAAHKKYRQTKTAAIPQNSKRIQRAYNAKRPFVQDVGVNHCGFYISMPKQFLNCPDIRAAFQKVSGKGMAECVAAGVFIDAGFYYRKFYGSLQKRFIYMPSSLLTCCFIYPAMFLRE